MQSSVPYNLRFPGQYYDSETGLNQNWNRDYDPLVAKYVESDPIGLVAGVNTYAYVNENPTWAFDPQGLEPKPLPKSRTRLRDCNDDEMAKCKAQCGSRGVQSCKVSQTFRITRTLANGAWLYEWKDGPPSCSCNDPENCPNAFQRAADALGISLATYLIISEGSRLFPPRNAVPVP